MWLSILALHCSCEWKLKETLTPSNDTQGIFGRAVAISKTEPIRLAVSASWDGQLDLMDKYPNSPKDRTDNAPGSIYVYLYDSHTSKFKLEQILKAKDSENVKLLNVGSTLEISSDGKRIVAGAPYSTVNDLKEAGALVVFDFNGTEFIQKTILHVPNPSNADEKQGLGRSLTMSTDGMMIASAYYNKKNYDPYDQGAVFVTSQQNDGTFTEMKRVEPKDVFDDRDINGKFFKFGSDLKITDATHLLVATMIWQGTYYNKKLNQTIEIPLYNEAGTFYLAKTKSGWKKESEIMPPETEHEIDEYGSPIGMPSNSKYTAGVAATFKNDKEKGAFYIHALNESTQKWQIIQELQFPEGEELDGIDFCNDEVFLTKNEKVKRDDGTTAPGYYIYRRNSNGQFELAEKLFGMVYDTEEENKNINYGSDVTWGFDCKGIFVGAMSKIIDEDNPKVHIPKPGSRLHYYMFEEKTNNNNEGNQAIIIGCSVAAAVVVIGIIAVVIIFVRKNKKSKDQAEI